MRKKLGYIWSVTKLPIVAVAFGFIVGAACIAVTGNNPLVAYMALFKGSLGSIPSFGETMYKVTPILFTGLAAAISFRCGLFNIGAEGQYVVATVATVAVAWFGQGFPRLILIPLILIAGFCAGGLWGGLAGLLKAKRGINEVISTIMLNWIALYVANYMVRMPLSTNVLAGLPPEGHSVIIPDAAKLTKLKELVSAFGYSSAHTGIFIALAAAAVMWYILFKTTIGYEIRSVGLNAAAAEYGGISKAKNTVLAMFLSGGLAGLGGAVQITGLVFMVNQSPALPGYGFTGLSVALVGCSHPLGCIPSALLFGILENGSRQMQLAGIPSEITSIISGVILVFIAGSLIIKLAGDRMKSMGKKPVPDTGKEGA